MSYLSDVKYGLFKKGEVHIVVNKNGKKRKYKILPDGRRYLMNREELYKGFTIEEEKPEEIIVFEGKCPECGSNLVYPNNIPTCSSCGYEYSGPIFENRRKPTHAEIEAMEIERRKILEDVRGNL